MPQAWTIKDGEGDVLRVDVKRQVVPTYYDAFRFHVSSSYREMFARDLAKVLAHKNWRVVRTRTKVFRKLGSGAGAQLEDTPASAATTPS